MPAWILQDKTRQDMLFAGKATKKEDHGFRKSGWFGGGGRGDEMRCDCDADFWEISVRRAGWMGIRLICMGSLWRRPRGFWSRGFGMRGVRGRGICMCEFVRSFFVRSFGFFGEGEDSIAGFFLATRFCENVVR